MPMELLIRKMSYSSTEICKFLVSMQIVECNKGLELGGSVSLDIENHCHFLIVNLKTSH